eukprot:11868738-Karenia_brevis.AAC.1
MATGAQTSMRLNDGLGKLPQLVQMHHRLPMAKRLTSSTTSIPISSRMGNSRKSPTIQNGTDLAYSLTEMQHICQQLI